VLPRRQHANGVPWLVWHGRGAWHCEGCGRAGSLPPFEGVAGFAKALGDLKRAHYHCRAGGVGHGGDGEGVGHPLNPDRHEH